jgi:hypothetical protein
MYSLKTLVIRTTVGLVLGLGFTYGVFKVFGPFFAGLSLVAPLLMLRPITLHATEAGWFASKAQALSRVNGRFYSCNAMPVDVVEDPSGYRWVETAAIRRITRTTTADAVFAGLYATGYESLDGNGYLRSDVLQEHLSTSRDPDTIKFKVWAQRNLAPLNAPRRFGTRDALLP